MSATQRRTATLTLISAVALTILVGAMGAGVASDTVSIVEYEPDHQNVTAGEEVTVEITLLAQQGVHGGGVDRVELTSVYDAAVFNVTNVEQGDWMEQGEETSVEMNVTEGDGETTIYQERVPSANGTSGSGTFAELTFEVDEDAEPGTYEIGYRDDAMVQMVSDHYQPVFPSSATITVTEPIAEEEFDGFGPMFWVGIGIVAAMVSLATYIRWQRETSNG